MTRIDRFDEIGIHRYLNALVSNEMVVYQYSLLKLYPALLMKSFQKGIKNLIYRGKASSKMKEIVKADKGFYLADEITSTVKKRISLLL